MNSDWGIMESTMASHPDPLRRQSALFLNVFRGILATLARQDVTGLENVPKAGPALLVFNQLSVFDTALLRLTMPRLDVGGLVARDYRSNPVFGFLVGNAGGIWITRDAGDRGALKAGLAALEQGWLLGISPEGRRSRTGGLERGKPGVAFLARRALVPIIPVALINSSAIAPNIKRLRRAAVSVRIGPPFTLPPESREDRRESRQETVDFIMCRLAALLPESYRGVYAGHPFLAAEPSARTGRHE